MVGFGSGHSGCGLEWAILNGLKMGWVRRVGWLTHIFHTQKKKKKKKNQKNDNFLRENESNKRIRLYVTNLLLYM